MKSRSFLLEKPRFLAVLLFGLLAGGLLISSFVRTTYNSFLCSMTSANAKSISEYSATAIQLQSIIHYATSRVVPQQSFSEISVSFAVLKERAPCNFLVFGLGHDSLMWTSLNPRGNTLFVEEDPKWIDIVLKDAPALHAHHVQYRTHLSEADALLASYKTEPNCLPSRAYLRGNTLCKLALTGLPDEFYDTEWDLIMIDAPKGYYAEAPGRMGAIFSAAVMARNRKGSGVTHVFLHDVNRRVERSFAEEFLCRKYLVKHVGRLWHFEIPAGNVSQAEDAAGDRFC